MVLVTNDGRFVQAGYLFYSTSEKWKDPSTWTERTKNPNEKYSIINFDGKETGKNLNSIFIPQEEILLKHSSNMIVSCYRALSTFTFL